MGIRDFGGKPNPVTGELLTTLLHRCMTDDEDFISASLLGCNSFVLLIASKRECFSSTSSDYSRVWSLEAYFNEFPLVRDKGVTL